ncbi:AAA family ATPase [Desulforudis sp. 1088]|jgi:nicotinamide riboside kinase|uniref:AAA family ATPase n=1 Tax=unclassified Candidatus Desulforudis TaxID=2635950 RepID=UPI0034906AEA
MPDYGKPKKIAILGGPGTGKTTLCKQLDVDYSMAGYKTGLCLEYVRTYIARYGVPTSIFEQFLLYEGQKRREEDLHYCDLIFCDNATILNYVYGLLSCDLKNPKESHALTQLFTWAIKDLPAYEIFYIPREFELTEDGIRYQDEDAAVLLDRKIKALLDLMHVPYTVVGGDLATRVALVKEKIGFEDMRHRIRDEEPCQCGVPSCHGVTSVIGD